MEQVAPRHGQRLLLATLFLFLLSEVFGGAIRYGLAGVGLAPLIYVPKVLLGLALLVALAANLARARMSAAYLAALALVALGVLHGHLVLGEPMQVAFGLWVLIPFLAGIVALPALVCAWPRLGLYALLLWAMAAGGVIVNVVYPFPWMGFEYSLAGVEIEGSRLWSTGGWIRLAGFSRASFDAATQVLLLGGVLIASGCGRWRFAVWLLSGVAIALTTTKTSTAIYLVLTFFWLSGPSVTRKVWRPLPIGLAAISFMLPFSTVLVDYDVSWVREGPAQRLFFASVADRLEWMWPDTLAMLLNQGNWLFGRGVGGIGAAQHYFEPVLYSPADNLVVYLYALFGILGIGSLVLYAVGLALFPMRDRLSLLAFAGGLTVLLGGLTGNVLESAVHALAFGASLRYTVGAVLGTCLQSSAVDVRQAGPLWHSSIAAGCESDGMSGRFPTPGGDTRPRSDG